MKTCAGIVLYNPNITRLKENVDSIINQVDTIVLVDNGSNNATFIDKLILEYDNFKLYLIRNTNNEGIAKALNQILNYAYSNEITWFLTLDQDTISKDGLIRCYLSYIQDNIGQLTCNILDRNIGIIDKVKNYNGKDIVDIDYCITSGCFNNTKAIMKIGGYAEKLFIDGVDLDISCNLRQHGFKVLCVNFDGILHKLGSGEIRKILGIKLITAHHVPWRNYYARRNIIYVARKYYNGIKKWKMIFKQIAYGSCVVLLEEKRLERLKYNFTGIIDGFKMGLVD